MRVSSPVGGALLCICRSLLSTHWSLFFNCESSLLFSPSKQTHAKAEDGKIVLLLLLLLSLLYMYIATDFAADAVGARCIGCRLSPSPTSARCRFGGGNPEKRREEEK